MDENEGLPAALQSQLEEVEQAHQEDMAPVVVGDQVVVAAPQPTGNTVAETAPDAGMGIQSEAQMGLQSQAPSTEKSYKHEYDCLQGKYNAEVQDVRKGMKQKEDEIDALREQLRSEKEKSFHNGPLDGDALKERYPGIIGDNELEFGTEIFAAQSRMANKESERLRQEFEIKLEEIRGQVTQQVGAQDERHFFDQLTQRKPDWEAVNASQTFQKWLAKVDPKTGALNDNLLKGAQKIGSADQAIAIFNAFHVETNPGYSSIEGQVAPSPVGAATEPGKKLYKFSEVQDVLNKLNKGGFFTPERELEIQKEMDLAFEENRIIEG